MPLIRNNMATSKVAVDKYVGTSYDIIKTVYDNLADITTIADSINDLSIQDTLFSMETETLLGSTAVSRLFTFSTIDYVVSSQSLTVYRNGQRLELTDDYSEPSSTTLLLTFDPNALDKFLFINNERVSSSSLLELSVTGNSTLGGVVIENQTTDIVTDTAACSITTQQSSLVTTGVAAPTLADGLEGQIKTIYHKTYAGAATITPANMHGGTSIITSAAGQSVVFKFTDSKWTLIGNPYGLSIT